MAGNKGHVGGRVSRQGDGPPGIGGSLVCDTEAPPPTVGPAARVCGARAESWPDRKENSLEFLPCPPRLPARSRLGPTLPLRDGGKPTAFWGLGLLVCKVLPASQARHGGHRGLRVYGIRRQ